MIHLHDLRAMQDAEGCFESSVSLPGATVLDRNGFITAIVVRALRHTPAEKWADLRASALSFLWKCRSMSVPGAFGFWPESARPSWASTVPADADDTALMLLELHRYGWVDTEAVVRTISCVLVRHRVAEAGEADVRPRWIATGSFYTWLAPPALHAARRPVNVVDCCVNANVAALLARVDARDFPGYREAVDTVNSGIDWAGTHALKLSSLTPFYPSLRSLEEAVEHAVECGALELTDAFRRLRSLPRQLVEGGEGVCRSAYGRTIWHSPAVDIVRSRVAHSNRDVA
jgi:hypothetical protein